jgi:hypothetical protein
MGSTVWSEEFYLERGLMHTAGRVRRPEPAPQPTPPAKFVPLGVMDQVVFGWKDTLHKLEVALTRGEEEVERLRAHARDLISRSSKTAWEHVLEPEDVGPRILDDPAPTTGHTAWDRVLKPFDE